MDKVSTEVSRALNSRQGKEAVYMKSNEAMRNNERDERTGHQIYVIQVSRVRRQIDQRLSVLIGESKQRYSRS